MRIVVLGVGAIGGTIAGLLALHGHEVLGIARGAQLAAITGPGLVLRQPAVTRQVQIPAVASPDEVDWRPDDAILLCTKTQGTEAALAGLRAAGVTDQPIFCTQNGVENERLTARRFPNVHAITVMLPAQYLEPGEVAAFGAPHPGLLDIGCFPGGHDAADSELSAILSAAEFVAEARDDVMRSKYGKLLLNLGNVVQAAHGKGPENDPLTKVLRAEALAAYAAAGIEVEDVSTANPRRELMQLSDIPGVPYLGGSSTQSLARGSGSIETDFINGEIALLGRLHGVPTPANTWYTRLGARMAVEGLAPFSIPRDEAKRAIGLT
ncbi:ketopantoate reductase family protein [Mesobacterium pallidum]|uniref:ketopantoate reductase family protein n=1 Tax=Mesobacterium pallidum TaxID=2872037 RepID=UPI001EE20FFE|nr:2-dehydropantoate 2-reductase N-terminal domain-containing protein [Mesobacterium pallidum]